MCWIIEEDTTLYEYSKYQANIDVESLYRSIITRHQNTDRDYTLSEEAKTEFNRIDSDFKDRSDDR